MEKVVILGANGQLGTAFKSNLKLDKRIDITKQSDVFETLANLNPDVIINCAAMTNVDECEHKREEAEAVNYHGVKNLVNLCKEKNIKLVQISTDYVFNNIHDMPIAETILFNPINWYGHTKAKAEECIIFNLSNYLIIRTSWLYGTFRIENDKQVPASNMINMFLTHNQAVVDQISRLTNVNTVVNAVKELLNKEEYGIFNVADSNETTPFQIAQFIQKSAIIKPILSRSLHRKAARPKYSVLSTNKIENLGIKINKWEDNLEEYLNAYHTTFSRI